MHTVSPDTVWLDAGRVPPSHEDVTRVTLRDCEILSVVHLPAALGLQGPVVQRQVGREQSAPPDTVWLDAGRVPPAQGWLTAVTLRVCATLSVLQRPAALGVQGPVVYRQVGGGQYFVP